ncbi:hypothetical protein [Celeribacter arenosi]|uniref:Uncharacterized protein n=1 Tax=Celeribacter arenosi TaxID=792649 RepID=A0ABP7JXR9_9RHOB
MRFTKVTAGLVALSVTMGAAAAPARASDADVARAVGGLLTLFVIGKALENNSSKSAGKVKVATTTNRKPSWEHNRGNSKNSKNRRTIPEECVIDVRGYGSANDVAVKRCLTRSGVNTDRLPRQCAATLNTRRGPMSVYRTRCLADFGYRVADRGRRY